VVLVTFDINLPTSVSSMFGTWFKGLNQQLKYHSLVGVSALCWILWLGHNDMVFNKVKAQSSM
jgi:hypothetical protein